MFFRSVVMGSAAATAALLLLSGCGGGGSDTPVPPKVTGVKEVALRANDLAYDAASGRIFASVPSSAGTERGNTITVINPATATLGGSVFVGSEPNKLAPSDNGQYLYVGLDGTAAVRRYNVSTATPDLQFTLQGGGDSANGQTGSFFVEDLEALPGQPESVAVSRRNFGFSPRHEGVAIYDNGVPRPNVTPGHTGSNVIEFGASAARLYGYNNETSEFGFRRMNVDASGVTVQDVADSFNSNLLAGSGDIAYDGGRIFATSGRVIDPEARTLLGTFNLGSFLSEVRLCPDAARNRVYFLTRASGSSTVQIRAFDATTFVEVASLEVPNIAETPSYSSTARTLIRWGQTGLAFNTTDGRVILIGRAPGL